MKLFLSIDPVLLFHLKIEKLSEEKKQLEEKLDVANKSNKEKESKGNLV